jgi:hypothetical protein
VEVDLAGGTSRHGAEKFKPNGRDPHPPPTASTPRQAKARQNKSSARAPERKLLETMRATPGLSIVALAKAAGSSRSATGARLRQLGERGVIEKDAGGHWSVKEEPRQDGQKGQLAQVAQAPPVQPNPTLAPPA